MAQASDCSPFPPPAQFDDSPCLQIVDRSVESTIAIDYQWDPVALMQIPEGAVETVRFFAFTERPLQRPNWISEAQYEAAREQFAELDDTSPCWVPPEPVPEQILELDETLAGTWTEITTEPLPISAKQAEQDIVWDTQGVEPGAYLVYAYSYGGRFSAWSERPTIVVVTDDAGDPSVSDPTIFLRDLPDLGSDTSYFPGQRYTVEGCTHAAGNAELFVEWAVHETGTDLSWETIASCLPAERNFEVPFVLPGRVAGEMVVFRGRLQQPSGQATAAMTRFTRFGPDCEEQSVQDSACDEFVPADPDDLPELDRCPGEDDTDTDTDTDTGTDTGTETTDSDTSSDGAGQRGGAGCSCRQGRGAAWPSALALLWVLVGRRLRDRAG